LYHIVIFPNNFDFTGISLYFYIEENLSGKDRKMLADAVTDINKRFFSKSLPFNLTRAEVRKFDDFSEFYRQNHWPVYVL